MIGREMAMSQDEEPANAKHALDMGETPLTVSPAAAIMLARLPQKALERMSQKLALLMRRYPPPRPVTTSTTTTRTCAMLLQFRLKPMEAMDVDDKPSSSFSQRRPDSTYASARSRRRARL
jgi:hypothetical protein